MDIIDIVLAKTLAASASASSVEGLTELIEQANQTLANAKETLTDANDAVTEANKTLDEANKAVESANEAVETANQTNEQTSATLSTIEQTVADAQETIETAKSAVDQVAAIEEAAAAAAEKAEAASASFDTMKEDLLTAAEGLVDEAVVEIVNRELTNLNNHMDQVDATVKGFETTVAAYDEKINYLTDELPVVNASAFEADKKAVAAQKTADTANQLAHDTNLLAQTLDQTTGIMGAQLMSLADRLDTTDENISSLQGQQTAISTSLEETKNSVQDLEKAISSIEVNILDVTLSDESDDSALIQTLKISKDGDSTEHQFKNYIDSGENTDGSMTQKAITDYVTGVKEELEAKIENFTPTPSGGNTIDLGKENAGKLVRVKADGAIEASKLTEDDIVRMQLIIGSYEAKNSVGLEVDYLNKTCFRTQDAVNMNPGDDFDSLTMFGGRKRCVVDNNGTIVAFEDDDNFVEDGTKGQVMVYQPKFYYLRAPIQTTSTAAGLGIVKEEFVVSETAQAGFDIHPLFVDDKGNELDYVLLPAYEGSAQRADGEYVKDDAQDIDFASDLLSSIAGVKPISGQAQDLTLANAAQLASNRGDGWQLTDMRAESVNQFLMSIEYGSMNLQSAFERGISDIEETKDTNSAAITGSTSSLKSKSGSATETSYGGDVTQTESGKVAISYRGIENPYGNIWHFVNGVTINGDGSNTGGNVTIGEKRLGYKLPTTSSWLSSFGSDQSLNWAFIPSLISNNPNSSVPVGDYSYILPSLNGTNCCIVGGKCNASDYNGPFYYSFAAASNIHAHSIGANLMFIPSIDSPIYKQNHEKWLAKMGG